MTIAIRLQQSSVASVFVISILLLIFYVIYHLQLLFLSYANILDFFYKVLVVPFIIGFICHRKHWHKLLCYIQEIITAISDTRWKVVKIIILNLNKWYSPSSSSHIRLDKYLFVLIIQCFKATGFIQEDTEWYRWYRWHLF